MRQPAENANRNRSGVNKLMNMQMQSSMQIVALFCRQVSTLPVIHFGLHQTVERLGGFGWGYLCYCLSLECIYNCLLI